MPERHTWYRFRMQVDESGAQPRVRAKVWKRAASEPGAWQIDCVASGDAIPSQGTVGVWSSDRGKRYWDDLRVEPLSH
jgi:hypothetical protein